jgi:hypothetical protein
VPRLEVLEDRTVLSTLTVTSSLDDSSSGTLRAVIASAGPGDTIGFAKRLEGDIITLTQGQLPISTDLTIQGPGADRLTISGNGTSRVFAVGSGVTLTLAWLTVANGLAAVATPVPSASIALIALGGGILNDGGTVTVSNVTFADNVALGASPTLASSGGSSGPGRAAEGGAVRFLFGTLTLTDSVLAGNRVTGGAGGSAGTSGLGGVGGAAIGGGLAVGLSGFAATAIVTDTAIADNLAIGGAGGDRGGQGGDGLGGGVSNGPGSDLSLDRDTIAANQAVRGSAGSGGNAGNGVGSGVYNLGSVVEDLATTIFGNEASSGNDDYFGTPPW